MKMKFLAGSLGCVLLGVSIGVIGAGHPEKPVIAPADFRPNTNTFTFEEAQKAEKPITTPALQTSVGRFQLLEARVPTQYGTMNNVLFRIDTVTGETSRYDADTQDYSTRFGTNYQGWTAGWIDVKNYLDEAASWRRLVQIMINEDPIHAKKTEP